MTYDFTTLLDRTGKDAEAMERIPIADAEIQEGFSRIPMWIADMNFITCPTITEALEARIKTPAYGYYIMRPEYYESIIRWQSERNSFTGITKDMIGYHNGVLGGLASALHALLPPGGKILIHSPTYIGFTMVAQKGGYEFVFSPLVKDEQDIWRMDFEDMDRKLREEDVHIAIFCSPHNPAGRVWERWEIEKAMEVFRKNDCIVISDEIWSDLTLYDYRHIPTASVSEDAMQRTIAFYAPSKTFNLAGLQGSYHIIPNAELREKVEKQANYTNYNTCNVLSMHALIGAYRPEGALWVDELRQVLSDNVDFAYDYIHEHFKGVKVSKPEGTYMLFLDVEDWCDQHGKTLDDVLKAGVAVGVVWMDGRLFGGKCAIRMNLALPTATVQEAFERLDCYVFNA